MPEDVNGIQSDDIGAATAAHTDKIVQIGKIADSPIAAAAQRIQLNAETPQLFFRQGRAAGNICRAQPQAR